MESVINGRARAELSGFFLQLTECAGGCLFLVKHQQTQLISSKITAAQTDFCLGLNLQEGAAFIKYNRKSHRPKKPNTDRKTWLNY